MVGLLTRFASWIGRSAALYFILVIAIGIGMVAVPWLKAEWLGPARHRENVAQLVPIVAELGGVRRNAQRQLSAAGEQARTMTREQIDAALQRATAARGELLRNQRSSAAQSISLALLDMRAILADRRRAIEIDLRTREIEGLQQARRRLITEEGVTALLGDLKQKLIAASELNRQALKARGACLEARSKWDTFERRWAVTKMFRSRERETLRSDKQKACEIFKQRRQAWFAARRAHGAALSSWQSGLLGLQRMRGWSDAVISDASGDLVSRMEDERTKADGSLRAKLELYAERWNLWGILRCAAWALAGIIIGPYVIRVIFYWVLAPIAARRPAIRLRMPAAAIPLAARSATSVGVTLAAGEELLVRQDYLQASASDARKATRWLLDRRHPLTSVAAGLTFLTRIRGEGALTTVSAVRDPFAEVTVVTLPEGSACTLQPRALAAVAQPVGRPLRIEARWRLGSLHAWLTLQLRYLVFHGPARLVVKGGRGVRVEPAVRGRVFGQDQLVGFSADLAYSVTRTETFWPYFFGREPLLKDQVVDGDGVLIVEEAPMAGRRGGVGRGLEGAVDAGMKVFGV